MCETGDDVFLQQLVDDPQVPLMDPSDTFAAALQAQDWPDFAPQEGSTPEGSTFFSSLLLDDLLADSPQIAAPTWEEEDANTNTSRRRSKCELLEEVVKTISAQRTDLLAQLWVPILKNSKLLLSTQDQPYSVPHGKSDLVMYRQLSARYMFPTRKEGVEAYYPGLPGRVFTALTPEWSPNVQLYDSTDFLRVRDAARCNVRGTLGVPVIESETNECLAVIELVTNMDKVAYEAEMVLICNALQAVNLSSWANRGVPEVPREGREAVFAEISEVLTSVCEEHRLPIAQTWIPCLHDGHGNIIGLSNTQQGAFPESNLISLFTKHAPCHIFDSNFSGFHIACAEQRLEVGQGVAGKAFTTNQPCFRADVQSFTKTEYPLVQYARYFGLGGVVAIRLRSALTGSDDYIVEYVLPTDCKDSKQQQRLLNGISATMQRACKSLRTVSSKELHEQWPSVVELPEEDICLGSAEDPSKTVANKRRKLKQGDEWSGSSIPAAKKRNDRKRASNEKTVSLEVLQQYFAGSLRDAAKSIGVCPTTLKRICRQYGISRWPSRKINKVNRGIVKLQGVIESVEGVDRKVKLDALTGELASAAAVTAAITTTRNNNSANNSSETSKSSSPMSSPHEAAPVSNGREGVNVFQAPRSFNLQTAVKIEPRVHGSSEAMSVLENMSKFDGSSFTAELPPEIYFPPVPPVPDYIDWSALNARVMNPKLEDEQQHVTVKATLAADTIRFKVPLVGFGFCKLRAEVAARFKLEPDSFTLKYMDDDSEWVMLNCDADLQECLDVMRSSSFHVIKLFIHATSAMSSSPSLCSVNS